MLETDYSPIFWDVLNRKNMKYIYINILLLLPLLCRAEWIKVPDSETYKSDNKKYIFTTVTGNKDKSVNKDKSLKCKGKLSSNEEIIWERFLLNPIAPYQVYVANSGEYVVTVGEAYTYGGCPLVIYDQEGKLIRSHTLASLKSERDPLVFSFCGGTWHDDYPMFFNNDDSYFLIRKEKGIYVIVDLKTGDVLYNQKRSSSAGVSDIPDTQWENIIKAGDESSIKIAMKLLKSFYRDKRVIGCRICGEMKIKESIPILKKLLSSDYPISSKANDGPWMTVYPIRKAASNALKKMGVKHPKVIFEELDKEKNDRFEAIQESTSKKKIPMINYDNE
jgi:hypothetical protein